MNDNVMLGRTRKGGVREMGSENTENGVMFMVKWTGMWLGRRCKKERGARNPGRGSQGVEKGLD